MGFPFSGDGLRARLIRGGLGSAGVQAVNRVLALALGIVLARNLGPDGYGIYAYAFAIMGLLMVFAEAGVPTLLMREVAANQGREEWGLLRGSLRRAGQFVTLASGSITMIALLILWGIGDRVSRVMFCTMALMLLVLPLAAGTKTVTQALMGLQRVVLGQALNMLLRPLLVLALIGGGFLVWPTLRQPQYAMAAQLLAAAIVLIAGLFILRRLTPREARTAPPAYRNREWLRSALPFILIGGTGIIKNQTDILMLGWFMSAESIGQYRVAVQGATLVGFGLQVVNAVVAPQFSRLYANRDMERLQNLVTRAAQCTLLAALPLTLAFFFAGKVLISIVFGSAFAPAYVPLVILAFGQLIHAGFGSVGFLLNMTGHEGASARLFGQAALLNVLLNAILIPLFGTYGAATATTISLVVWNMKMAIQVRNSLKIIPTAFRRCSQ